MDNELENEGKELDSDMEELLELHEKALKRYKEAKDAWSDIYTNYVSDTKFALGDQWDAMSMKNRRANNRSALVYNKLPANIKYIVNNARMNTPSIKVHPIADGATKNTAKILDGIIKSIEYKSNAKSGYVNALKNAVTGGFGMFRVIVEDLDKDKRAELSIKTIKDPTFVLIDPSAENTDLSDAEYAFFVKWMCKEDFEEQFPGKESSCISPENKDWYKDNEVQVLEYWYRENGKFNYCILSAEDVLEHNTKYPGKYLPFMFVGGSEVLIDGMRDFKGIVRDVIDQQRMLNYSKSETADFITRSAKQQWLVEADQIAEYQDIWDSQNIDSFNYLPYKGTNSGGKPDKLNPPVPPSGFMATSQEADQDIRSTIGIRDPLQDIPASQSGKAIQLQISQGNIGIFEYLDNLNSAIKYCGLVLIDLIPHFYNYQHIRDVMGLDENITPTPIMTVYEDNGEMVIHDLKKGIYSVTLSTGPSYESQRSEAADKLIELVSKYPQMMQMAGDLIVKNMDFKGAEELADRLRATIPPNILAASNNTNGDKGQMLQVLSMQMEQMNLQAQQIAQENQMLKQQLGQAQTILNDKNQDRQLDLTKKQMDIEKEIQLKQLDIEFQMRKQEIETQSALLKLELNSKNDLENKLIMDDKETENNVIEYQEKKDIDNQGQDIILLNF